MDDYIDLVAVPQVKEICSNYGPDIPAIIWWDTGNEISHQQAEKLYQTVKELKPNIIMNDRLGGGFRGDTVTPEQHIPPRGYPDRNWETCMTINDTWGYKRDDDHWKSSETLIRNLCDIASKGGNYLLNIGPTAQGTIPAPEAERLAEIGRWMKVNGEAIYGSGPTPFGAEAGRFSEGKDGKSEFISTWDWRCTSKPGKLYLLIFNWPTARQFELRGLQSKVNRAYLLSDHASLNFTKTAEGVMLDLPEIPPDKIASVICVEIADPTANVTATN
jgi:alpha-L-fucosidase